MMITYYVNNKQVQLGDIVETKIWFRKKLGQVVYVPGISPTNKNIDFDGIQNVGIQVFDGPFIATFVDPETERLLKKVKFIRRGSVAGLGADENPFGDEETSDSKMRGQVLNLEFPL